MRQVPFLLLVLALPLAPVARAQSPAAPQNQKGSAQSQPVFSAYEGTANDPAGMSFQINSTDMRQPSQFLKLGDMIPWTKLRLLSFEPKSQLNPKTGRMDDVSELRAIHAVTGEITVLVLTVRDR